MLNKRDRITKRIEGDFFATARRWNFSWGRLYFLLGADARARLAIIAPKKQLRLSTARHQGKRKVAQAWRQLRDSLPPGEYVLVINEQVLLMPTEQIQTQLTDWSQRLTRFVSKA